MVEHVFGADIFEKQGNDKTLSAQAIAAKTTWTWISIVWGRAFMKLCCQISTKPMHTHVCVRVYVYMYVRVNTCVAAYMYVYECTCTCTCIRISCAYVYVCIRVCIRTCKTKQLSAIIYRRCHGLPERWLVLPPNCNGCIHVRICVYVYMYVDVYVYVCVVAYVYVYECTCSCICAHIVCTHTCVCLRACICICTNRKLSTSVYWGCHGLPVLVYQIQNLRWLWCLQGPTNLDAFLLMGLNKPLTSWGSNMWDIYALACGFICVRAHVYTHTYNINIPIREYMHTYIRKQFLSCFDNILLW